LALLSPFVTFCLLGTVVPFQHNGSCDYDCFPHQNRNNQRIAICDWLIYQKSLDIRLDSGSSWFDGVNGILMQQEPNLPKQDYWNRRAIASLANTLFTVVEPVPMPLLSSSYAAATALEMPLWNTVVIPTLVLIHITIINCERETNDAKGNVRGVSSLQSIS
jgi:hypothetical protein